MDGEQYRKDETALVVSEKRLPVERLTELSVFTGHSRGYLEMISENYDLTIDNLQEMIQYRDDFKTDFPSMVRLLKLGYSLEAINGVLETRQQFKDGNEPRDQGSPSLINILRLQDRFPELYGEDPNFIYDKIREIQNLIPKKYTDTSVSELLRLSDRFNALYLDSILEVIEDVKNTLIDSEGD